MITIYLAFSVIAVLTGVLCYTSAAHKAIKAVAIVGVVALGLGLEGHYRASLGKPIEDYPPKGFIYVHHEVQGEDIAIWVWIEETGNRLYTIPYTQETAEELAEAQKKGTPMEGEFIIQEGDSRQTPQSLIMDDWVGENTGEIKGG